MSSWWFLIWLIYLRCLGSMLVLFLFCASPCGLGLNHRGFEARHHCILQPAEATIWSSSGSSRPRQRWIRRTRTAVASDEGWENQSGGNHEWNGMLTSWFYTGFALFAQIGSTNPDKNNVSVRNPKKASKHEKQESKTRKHGWGFWKSTRSWENQGTSTSQKHDKKKCKEIRWSWHTPSSKTWQNRNKTGEKVRKFGKQKRKEVGNERNAQSIQKSEMWDQSGAQVS